jgi:hypothetical protein
MARSQHATMNVYWYRNVPKTGIYNFFPLIFFLTMKPKISFRKKKIQGSSNFFPLRTKKNARATRVFQLFMEIY